MPNQKKKTATPESANGSASSEETSGEASTPGADLDSGTLPVEGKAWQIAQLAAQVLNVRGIYERGGDAQHTRDLEDNWRDERLLTRIKESVRTARSILEVVSIPLVDERIDASTLFKPGVAINATKIAKRFKDVGWKNMGETRLKVRLVEIDKCWTRLINEWESRALLSENYVENAIEKIAAAIRVLSLDQEVNHSIYKFEDETRLLMRRIRDHNPSIPGYPPVMAPPAGYHPCRGAAGVERRNDSAVVGKGAPTVGDDAEQYRNGHSGGGRHRDGARLSGSHRRRRTAVGARQSLWRGDLQQ